MDQHITITSKHQNPSDFVSNFAESINLQDGCEIAVTKIFHGPVYNVTSVNNKFSLQKEDVQVDYEIPPGFYKGSCDILAAIYRELEDSRGRGHNGRGVNTLVIRPMIFAYGKAGESSSLRIVDTGVHFLIHRGQYTTLLEMLGYCIDDSSLNRLIINHYAFDHSTEVGCLYSNIVTNSIIDGQKSRLLGIIPIKNAGGYNYHEFINPVYNPLAVHSFTDINFLLTDIFGKVLHLDHTHSANDHVYGVFYPTIITLHIRKIKK